MIDDEFEGKLLSEQFGLSSPPAARSLETVEAELRIIQDQAQRAVLSYAIEAGRRLEEAKAMVEHGEWGGWLKKMGYAKSTAQNLMRIFREYGASQQSLFGGEAKSQTLGNLTYTKALRLLALPSEEEREEFMAEHDVEAMSTRELDRAIKEREAALEAAAAAEEEAQGARREADRLQEELKDQARVYEAKLTSAEVEAGQARAAVKEAQEAQKQAEINARRLQSELSAATTAATTAEVEHTQLLKELEELRKRPAETDTGAVEAARQAAIAEMMEKMDKAKDKAEKAEEKRKAAEEALEAALAELKAQEPQIRELTPEELQSMTAEAVERARAEDAERIRDMERQLAMANPDKAEFNAVFRSWQETYGKLDAMIERVGQTDHETAAAMRNAVRVALRQMGGDPT